MIKKYKRVKVSFLANKVFFLEQLFLLTFCVYLEIFIHIKVITNICSLFFPLAVWLRKISVSESQDSILFQHCVIFHCKIFVIFLSDPYCLPCGYSQSFFSTLLLQMTFQRDLHTHTYFYL